jgi:polyphosphate kinase 2
MSGKDKQQNGGHRMLKLGDLDHTVKLKRKEYEEHLYHLQVDLVRLQRLVVEAKLRVVLIFEGMDAAGKGGAIKRLVQFLDPRGVEVHPIGAPNYQELLHHYLRRFWQRLPAKGRIAIFDRSWYGRMLVEPIEGLCSDDEYERAAREICEFERVLADDGYCLVKFWLHIDKEEQLSRFEARGEDPLKKWKITKDDWRNRKKFDQYVEYADRMFVATDTDFAPWHLVAGNDKRHARITVAQTVVSVLDKVKND